MLRRLPFVALLSLWIGLTGPVWAIDPPSTGLVPGHDVPAFQVVKCAGAENDGVQIGDELCYRCRWGGRPVGLLFVRHIDPAFISLAKQLEARLAEKSATPRGVLICVLAPDQKTAQRRAKQLAESARLRRTAVVAPVEVEAGPKAYDLDVDASLTVLLYRKTLVEYAHAFPREKLDAAGAAQVLADFDELLKAAR